MTAKMPSGSSASGHDPRPRAQISYQGEDEFSTMSLESDRQEILKAKEVLSPSLPGEKPEVKVDELKPVNNTRVGIAGMLRKIFAK